MFRLKTVLCIVIVAMLLLPIAACSSGDTSEDGSEFRVYEDGISEKLSGEVPTLFVTVVQTDGLFSLDVSIGASGSVTNFGNYVLAIRDAFESEFAASERGDFSVSMSVSDNSMLRFSSSDYAAETSALSGRVSDNRSGELVSTSILSMENLFELFPAARSYAEERGYTE